MKVEIERDALLAALEQVKGVIEARNTIPVLSNVLFAVSDGVLTVTGTDLDIEASATAPASGEILTTLPSDKIMVAAKSFKPGKLTIAPVEGRGAVTVKQGRGVRTISTLSADDFPKRGALDGGISFGMPSDVLVRLFGTCRIAQSTDETRYYLIGVFLHAFDGKLRAAATDGHRLIRAEADLPESAAGLPDIIVPTKAVAQVLQMLGKAPGVVQITVATGAIQFKLGSSTIISKLVEGRFPDYARVIPDQGNHVITIGRESFIGPVAAVSAIVNAEGDKTKVRAVAFDFGAGDEAYEVSAKDQAGTSAIEPLEASFTGAPIRFGLNSQYARDVAGIFAEGSSLTISLHSDASPLRIVSDKDADLIGVVMPMRV
nr:DNA polymerase III subunit beta [uncultured Sphingomonas sp.]